MESPSYTAAMALLGLGCAMLGVDMFRSSVAKLRRQGLALGDVVRDELGPLVDVDGLTGGEPVDAIEEPQNG